MHLTAEDTITARDPAGQPRGFIRWRQRRDGFASIEMIEAFASSRCGLGTKLYEAAATHLCARGLRLASGKIRSHAADGFWQKQTRKGRAECLKPYEDGIYFDQILDEEPGPPCGGYAIKKSMCAHKRITLGKLRR